MSAGGPSGPVRIVLTGAESTGKTTLAATLAGELRVPWAPEYARQYAAAVGRPLTVSDVEPIARGQLALEDEVLRRGSRVVVLDTDLVSTVVYARHYYGACPAWIVRAAGDRRAELYLLLHPDVPWVADPARDQPEAREVIHARFVATLAELGAPHVVHVAGDWAARASVARTAVGRTLATRRSGDAVVVKNDSADWNSNQRG